MPPAVLTKFGNTLIVCELRVRASEREEVYWTSYCEWMSGHCWLCAVATLCPYAGAHIANATAIHINRRMNIDPPDTSKE